MWEWKIMFFAVECMVLFIIKDASNVKTIYEINMVWYTDSTYMLSGYIDWNMKHPLALWPQNHTRNLKGMAFRNKQNAWMHVKNTSSEIGTSELFASRTSWLSSLAKLRKAPILQIWEMKKLKGIASCFIGPQGGGKYFKL